MRPPVRFIIALVAIVSMMACAGSAGAAVKRQATTHQANKGQAAHTQTAKSRQAAKGQTTKRHASRHAPRSAGKKGRGRQARAPNTLRFPDAQLNPADWAALDGWADDNHVAAFATFRTSCRPLIARAKTNTDSRLMLRALAAVCQNALAMNAPTEEAARNFFEENFRPVRISKLNETAGFLTGYYEPVVDGSRFPTQIFKVPVYRRPDDLVAPGGVARGSGFPNTGRSMRRSSDGELVPYYERAEIEDGALDGRHLEICWLKDPIDLFYIQIQGSGRVRLEDGTMLRINYDAHNGHPYTPVGRILIERGQVPRDEMSMERIRTWMEANPDGGKELRRRNKSFVFFRVVGLSEDREAEGAQGVPLTPGRSIAVDKALHVYGTPFFIEADLPAEAPHEAKFRRLVVAQDTGSAIVGPARADIYYGAGDDAGRIAGGLRHPGLFALLVPRGLELATAKARVPLPEPRPKSAGPGAREQASIAEETPLPRPDPRTKPKLRRPG